MRPIKFRGRNSKHSKRLYGDLFRSRGEWFITQDGIVDNPLAEPNDWKVDPESVGEFTGLLDKGDQEIYEGDIVAFKYYGPTYIGEVSSNEFFHSCIKVGEKEYHIDNAMIGEIVGNIYENPGLLNQ